MAFTTIAITKKFKQKLDNLKEHKRESYMDIIKRLIKNDKNN